MKAYTVYDNTGKPHTLHVSSDSAALWTMQRLWRNYIASILSSDSIILVRPSGYILAYINTASGEQTMKSMQDWTGEPSTDPSTI